MIYAQIKNNKVVNTIVIDEDTDIDLFAEGYDYFLPIDDANPRPSVGWSYNDGHYAPPSPPIPELK